MISFFMYQFESNKSSILARGFRFIFFNLIKYCMFYVSTIILQIMHNVCGFFGRVEEKKYSSFAIIKVIILFT